MRRMPAALCRMLPLLILLIVPARDACGQSITEWFARGAQAIGERTRVENGIRYVKTGASVEDLDLARLKRTLERFGIEIPFAIEGNLSASLDADIPVSSPRDGRLYRATGTIESSRLVIEGLELQDIAARLQYRDGTLELEQMRIRIADEDAAMREPAPARVLLGRATMQVLPAGPLCGAVRLNSVTLSPIVAQIPELAGMIDGVASGELEFCVPSDQLRDVTAWAASGPVSVVDLNYQEIDVNRVSTQLNLGDGELTAREFVATLPGASVTGRAQLSLRGQFPASGEFALDGDNLSQFLGNFDDAGEQIAGESFSGTAAVRATLQPLTYSATGRIAAEDVAFQDLSLDSLAADYLFDQQGLALSDLDARLWSGRLTGEARLPFDPAQAAAGALAFADVQLSDVADQLDLPPLGLGGQARGEFAFAAPASELGETSTWVASGSLVAEELTLFGLENGQFELGVSIEEGLARLTELSGAFPGLRFGGSARLALEAPYAWGFAGSIDTVPPGADGPPALQLPGGLQGELHATTDLAGQLSPMQIEGNARLRADDLRRGRFVIDNAEVELIATREAIRLEAMELVLLGGRVTGDGSIPLTEDAAGTAALQWNGLSVDAMVAALNEVRTENEQAEAAPELPVEGGTTSGNVRITIPQGAADDVAAWQASGSMDVTGLQFAGQPVEQFTAAFRKSDETVELSEFEIRSGEQRIEGRGTVAVTSPHPWSATFDIDAIDLDQLDRIAPTVPLLASLNGRVSVEGTFSGELETEALTGQAHVAARDLQVLSVPASQVSFDVRISRNELSVANFSAQVADGSVQADVRLPLHEESPGEITAEWRGVQIARFIDLAGEAVEEPWSEITGEAEGNLTLNASPGDLTQITTWSGEARFNVAEIRLEGDVVGEIGGVATLQDAVLTYDIDGELFGGTVEIDGNWPDEAAVSATETERGGRLAIRGLSLDRAVAVLGLDALSPLSGRLSATVQFQETPFPSLPSGSGRVTFTALRWGNDTIASELVGGVAIADGRLRLTNLGGSYAGGQLMLATSISLTDGPPGTMTVVLTNARLDAAAAPWTDVADPFDGRLDLRVDIRLGEVIFGSGYLVASDLTFADGAGRLSLGNWRAPVRLRFDPRIQALRLETASAAGHIAHGRTTGSLTLTMGRTVGVASKFDFRNVDSSDILRQFGATGRIGRGKISGRVVLSSRNLRSLADVDAVVDARLVDTQASAVPILGELQPFLSSVIPPSTRLQQGELRGRLSRGVFRLERLSMTGPTVNLYAEGTVTVGGRINLEVTADTGRLRSDRLLARFFLNRVIEVASPPVGLLLRANQFLSDRVVHLKVTGTLSAPRIQVRPLRTLGEEGLRFFLLQAVQ